MIDACGQSGNVMTVRPLTGHEPLLAQNVIGAVAAAQPGWGEVLTGALADGLPDSVRARGGDCFGVVVRESLVGTIVTFPEAETSGAWRLALWTLLPDWRGMGIGRLLAETAIEHARTQGATRILADIHTDCEAAFKLLRTLYFDLIDEVDPVGYEGVLHLRRVFAR